MGLNLKKENALAEMKVYIAAAGRLQILIVKALKEIAYCLP